MHRIVIESPYAGDMARNETYARRAMRDSVERGEAPFASHLLYTQPGILDENNPKERALGIECGYAWSDHADKIVFYVDYGMSPGMQSALNRALLQNARIETRKIGENP